MDIRTTDSAGLAAKRLQFDHVQPTKDKGQSSFQNQDDVKHVGEDQKHSSHHAPQDEQGGGNGADDAEALEAVVDKMYDASGTTGHGEHHVLDFKV